MDSSVRLIHIAPELPPVVGGVADYTAVLSRRLVEVSEGAVRPVLVHAGEGKAHDIDVEFPVTDLSGQCSADVLAATIEKLANEAEEQVVVLLEYSGYGYSKRGAPLWLARGLDRVCGEEGFPLVTMFHELYATGPPWTSAFWYSFMQRHVGAKLARLSAEVIANRESAVPWLANRGRIRKGAVHVQPVFSNVGEPKGLPICDQRVPYIVVFGGGGRKLRVYEEHGQTLQRLISHHGFDRIIDLGPPANTEKRGEAWIEFCGTLPAEEISRRLLTASLGVISYPATRLGKSGAAAAFASHGIPFILFNEDGTLANTYPYVEGKHFFRGGDVEGDEANFSMKQIKEMSEAIRTLYQNQLHSSYAAQCVLNCFDSLPHSSSVE
ncbi:hypothetical protein GGP50_002652 [Salinibacter ruber]|uniref:hypothetical protein n=1 Tax=Salinibacter ruber TaxID=146919 RepID=UPI00216A75D6|nr:hypothetical protein [Salinibacter ruber]MCS4194426.1 hypothetical protein [Salinibacter ruber]